MTNYDFYKDTLLNGDFGVIEGKPIACLGTTPCADCLFDTFHSCADARWEWLKAEYKEYEEPNPKRIIDVDEFKEYLEDGISYYEEVEQVCANDSEYTSAIEHRARADVLYGLLCTIQQEPSVKWIKEVEE